MIQKFYSYVFLCQKCRPMYTKKSVTESLMLLCWKRSASPRTLTDYTLCYLAADGYLSPMKMSKPQLCKAVRANLESTVIMLSEGSLTK